MGNRARLFSEFNRSIMRCCIAVSGNVTAKVNTQTYTLYRPPGASVKRSVTCAHLYPQCILLNATQAMGMPPRSEGDLYS
jgi:hypothetical protein